MKKIALIILLIIHNVDQNKSSTTERTTSILADLLILSSISRVEWKGESSIWLRISTLYICYFFLSYFFLKKSRISFTVMNYSLVRARKQSAIISGSAHRKRVSKTKKGKAFLGRAFRMSLFSCTFSVFFTRSCMNAIGLSTKYYGSEN